MNAQNRSHDEFARLALPLFDSLYNFARWLTHDGAEAQDLVQEVYVKALKGFSSFESGSDFSRLGVPHPAQYVSNVPHRVARQAHRSAISRATRGNPMVALRYQSPIF